VNLLQNFPASAGVAVEDRDRRAFLTKTQCGCAANA
jgi:hypothetical protein